ncbi:(E)-2-((N-methylformamido)methylene)succinate hydrolase [Paraconexibacter sp. AEG42_29]|uniref:(E)-2-((N-methylformamido)methylene)succinate hydrolase n=1 Tax=Paraconexibacter sp. AEG42_29 TaxID=2997339 RepID=A0AAU7API8_9ACTN
MATIDSLTPPPPWTDTDWSAHVREAVIGGRRLRYLDYGDGPPLLLLHGLGCSWQWWLEMIPSLAREHRVIAVDLPGFGRSDALDPPALMNSHAEAMFALADELDLGPLVVAGHSMGGLITLAMAVERPERVRGVVLINAGGVPMTGLRLAIVVGVLRASQRFLAWNPVTRLLVTRTGARRLLLRGALKDPGSMRPELAAEVVPLMASPGFLDAITAASEAVRASRPEDVTCPVLLIWGAADPIVRLASARQMQERLADARLEVIPGIGHTPMVEAPAVTTDHLLSFTRDLDEGPA